MGEWGTLAHLYKLVKVEHIGRVGQEKSWLVKVGRIKSKIYISKSRAHCKSEVHWGTNVAWWHENVRRHKDTYGDRDYG